MDRYPGTKRRPPIWGGSTLGWGTVSRRCHANWSGPTWEDEANAEIAPRIGLPQLPVVTWPEPSNEHEREDQWFGLHWKTRTVVAWADNGYVAARVIRDPQDLTIALRTVALVAADHPRTSASSPAIAMPHPWRCSGSVRQQPPG